MGFQNIVIINLINFKEINILFWDKMDIIYLPSPGSFFHSAYFSILSHCRYPFLEHSILDFRLQISQKIERSQEEDLCCSYSKLVLKSHQKSKIKLVRQSLFVHIQNLSGKVTSKYPK